MPRVSRKKISQRKAFLKYRSNSIKAYTFCFHKEYDKKVIEKLESVDNKTDYVRKLIEEDWL